MFSTHLSNLNLTLALERRGQGLSRTLVFFLSDVQLCMLYWIRILCLQTSRSMIPFEKTKMSRKIKVHLVLHLSIVISRFSPASSIVLMLWKVLNSYEQTKKLWFICLFYSKRLFFSCCCNSKQTYGWYVSKNEFLRFYIIL